MIINNYNVFMEGDVKNLKLVILNKSLNSDDLPQVINCLAFITTANHH